MKRTREKEKRTRGKGIEPLEGQTERGGGVVYWCGFDKWEGEKEKEKEKEKKRLVSLLKIDGACSTARSCSSFALFVFQRKRRARKYEIGLLFLSKARNRTLKFL